MKQRIVYFITSSMSVMLVKGQLSYFSNLGYNVYLVSSPGKELNSLEKDKVVKIFEINIPREISLVKDLLALLKILFILNKLKPQVVNYGTPKAALLASVAAYITKVPVRIYTLRGLRLETAKGFKKRVLVCSEKLTCFCSNKVICVSKSLEKKANMLGLADESKTTVLGSGSSNGIDLNAFDKLEHMAKKVKLIREKCRITENTPVIGFVGRVVRDKGIVELIETFKNLLNDYKDLKLLILGSYEDSDKIPDDLIKEIDNNPNIIYSGEFDYNIIPYYYVMDILVLPTYREGFPNVVLEAAAAQTPAVTTDATGAIDSVLDGQTGFIVPVGNSNILAAKISFLLSNPEIARQYGQAGRKRVEEEFQSCRKWEELNSLYSQLLIKHSN